MQPAAKQKRIKHIAHGMSCIITSIIVIQHDKNLHDGKIIGKIAYIMDSIVWFEKQDSADG